MNFLATHPSAKLHFFTGTMQLMVDSDVAYLVLHGAKSQISGHFYFAFLPSTRNYNGAPNNAPVLTECKMLKHVVCSTGGVECIGFFHNGCTAIVICSALNEMGHQQLTHTRTGNKLTNSFVHASMHVK
eukprot:1137625-Ditylum_brightwellii.AAC.1